MKNIVLITGVTSGVGLSLVKHLSSSTQVIALGRQGDTLHNLFKENPNVSFFPVDLLNLDALDKALADIFTEYPFIPYVINNAGINVAGSIEALDLDDIRDSFQVNCLAPAAIIKRAVPGMKLNNFGRIINITSGAPLNCFPGYWAYSASKGALNAMTVTAAKEYADYNIKINLMSPGPVRSNMAPSAPMEPIVCHPTVDYLLGIDENGPTGRFFWLGYEIPLFPDLSGIQWLEGKADNRFRRVL